jgi:hypothetical protein
MATDPPVPPGVDPTTPSPARLYDYYLGGTTNYAADRMMAKRLGELIPELEDTAWANRAFHQRAAIWLAGRGIRQFLDLGSGLPTQGNTHEAVQAGAPQARVVYVDHDPMVMAYAKGLLADSATTTLIQADLRDPATVLDHPNLRALIDLGEPVGLLMTAVLQFVADESNPWGLVASYVSAICPGSYLALSHITRDKLPPRLVETGVQIYQRATESAHPRTKAEIERFFTGLELVPPYEGAGPIVTNVGLWGSEDPDSADSDGSRAFYCGVARRT